MKKEVFPLKENLTKEDILTYTFFPSLIYPEENVPRTSISQLAIILRLWVNKQIE